LIATAASSEAILGEKAALADPPGLWIDAVHDRRPPKSITLDMDSSESPVHGDQEGSAWKGQF